MMVGVLDEDYRIDPSTAIGMTMGELVTLAGKPPLADE
jgi:hypothetical protein